MVRVARAPPVVGLALAFGAGSTLLHLGVSLPWTLLPLPLLLLPNRSLRRPGFFAGPTLPALYFAFLAGGILTHQWLIGTARDCRLHIPDGAALALRGEIRAPIERGRGELRVLGEDLKGCRGPLRVIVPDGVGGGEGGRLDSVSGEGPVEVGVVLRVWGRWWQTGAGESGNPSYAGYLLVDSLRSFGDGRGEPRRSGAPRASASLQSGLDRLGAAVQERLAVLFPETDGLARALIWARKDGLEPEVRDAFARAGTAHLLAISGFHVGVVAGLLLLLAGAAGLSHPLRYSLASGGVWVYVVAIGLPDAASRAALILTVLTMGRLRGRAVVSLGTLATAFVLLLLFDPGSLMRPGFQLSFAGAAGLVLGSRSVAGRLGSLGGLTLSHGLSSALAAGVTATVATLPFVAWHFGRVSLVGIPMTLAATPLVTPAIPGILASLLLSLVHPGLGRFLAMGVEADLLLLQGMVTGVAGMPWASVWVSRPSVTAGILGAGAGIILAVVLSPRRGRRLVPVWTFAAALILTPLVVGLGHRGTLELVALDVGQGDALLLRSPRGRWIIVDAGPRTERFDAGGRVVLPYLRRRGVPELELMLLTHPDMDHVGGAPAILRSFSVGRVLDPGLPAGKEVFLDALDAAALAGVPWTTVGVGDSLNLDGVALRVLAPTARGLEAGAEDANAASLVMELRYGSFSALLTGDAPVAVEDEILNHLLSGDVTLLKIGHHGSSTSTGLRLLQGIRPRIAVISVGRRNRFGHPHPTVLHRLDRAGVRVLRTDELGTVSVKARKDGTYRVRGPLTGN